MNDVQLTSLAAGLQPVEVHVSERVAFAGVFLDGNTAVKWPVMLEAGSKGLVMHWEQGQRILQAGDVLPIQPHYQGVQFICLADGGTCEMPASPGLLTMLTQAGVAVRRESALAAVMQGDWRIVTMALGFLVGVIVAFYVWLLPSAAVLGASMMPVDIQRGWGETALRQMERQWLSPSRLPAAQHGRIQQRFELLTQELSGPESAGLELRIRKSSIGPNAFALPGNFVVLTDELVTLVDGDLDAISGVLAHELGHLRHQHGLRSVVQATALTLLGSAVIGDYSSLLAAIPAALGHLKYSRHFEAEADTYARDVLCEADIAPASAALFFERVDKIDGNLAELVPSYLSSHPDSKDRAAFFRNPCPRP